MQVISDQICGPGRALGPICACPVRAPGPK